MRSWKAQYGNLGVEYCQISKCDIAVNIGATLLARVPFDASPRELSNGMLGVHIAGLQRELCTLECNIAELQSIHHVEAGKMNFVVFCWTKMGNLSCSSPSSTVQRMMVLMIDDLGSWKVESEVMEGLRWQFGG